MLLEKETVPKVEESTLHDGVIKLEKLFQSLSEMPSDFYSETRVDEPSQERKDI